MDWPGWDKIAQEAVKEALDAVTVEIGGREVSFQDLAAASRDGNIVEVVRCGDCKWGRRCGKLIDCRNGERGPMLLVEADWFCADGERGTEDGEEGEHLEGGASASI